MTGGLRDRTAANREGGARNRASRPRIEFLALLLAVLAAGACDPETVGNPAAAARSASDPVVRDSAGITVVANTVTPAWDSASAWRLADEPSLRIGAVEGPPHLAFGYALAPVRLSDGRIVVADRQRNHVHFYSADGAHLQTVGRTGQGPGEFTQIWRMYRIQGDSLMVLNPATLTTIFSPEGDFVRRYQLEPVPGRPNIWWKGRFPDGSMLAFSLAQEGTRYEEPPPGRDAERRLVRPDRSEFYRDSLLHFLYTADGELVDSLMKIPGQWLSDNDAFAPSDAYRIDGPYFHTSPGNVVEIESWRYLEEAVEPSPTTPAGLLRLERIVRRPPLDDITVTEPMKEAYREERRAFYREISEQDPRISMQSLERGLDQQTFPPTIPAHGNALRVDPGGNLWLLEYRQDDGEPKRWSVFDPDGTWLGVVETPPRFAVNEIGRDYVLGVARDELDVQYVELYPLEKPGG